MYLSIGLIVKIRDCGIDMFEELVYMNVDNLTKSALLKFYEWFAPKRVAMSRAAWDTFESH